MSGQSNTSNLEGTRAWRLQWWQDIIDYTVHGRYFWTGKGFGINLADDDDYQGTVNGLPNRSPHNIQMTVLARAGVPGLVRLEPLAVHVRAVVWSSRSSEHDASDASGGRA